MKILDIEFMRIRNSIKESALKIRLGKVGEERRGGMDLSYMALTPSAV